MGDSSVIPAIQNQIKLETPNYQNLPSWLDLQGQSGALSVWLGFVFLGGQGIRPFALI